MSEVSPLPSPPPLVHSQSPYPATPIPPMVLMIFSRSPLSHISFASSKEDWKSSKASKPTFAAWHALLSHDPSSR
eukprot:1291976-Pyramimonas_sp.AAC.1